MTDCRCSRTSECAKDRVRLRPGDPDVVSQFGHDDAVGTKSDGCTALEEAEERRAKLQVRTGRWGRLCWKGSDTVRKRSLYSTSSIINSLSKAS